MPDDRTEAERIDPAEHVDKDDPRYDGFRIREYWLATAIAPDDQEAALGVDLLDATMFELAPGPAMAADERRLLRLRQFAQAIVDRHGIEVRVRHFVPEGDDEVFRR